MEEILTVDGRNPEASIWYVKYIPIKYRASFMSGGVGFLSSTVYYPCNLSSNCPPGQRLSPLTSAVCPVWRWSATEVWPPLLLVLARLHVFWSVAAPGPSQPSRPPPCHRLRLMVHRYDWYDTMVCPQALPLQSWQGSQHPNIHEMNLSQVTWQSVREKCASSTKS